MLHLSIIGLHVTQLYSKWLFACWWSRWYVQIIDLMFLCADRVTSNTKLLEEYYFDAKFWDYVM